MRAWFRSGTPWIWLNGGAIALCLVMVIGILGLIAVRGGSHFWPADLQQTEWTPEQGEKKTILGELVRSELVSATMVREAGASVPEGRDSVTRYLVKVGNRDIYGRDFAWYMDYEISGWTIPQGAIALERRERGNFYGFPLRLTENGQLVAEGSALWAQLQQRIERANKIFDEMKSIEKNEISQINNDIEKLRLKDRKLVLSKASEAELAAFRAEADAERAALNADYEVIQKRLDELRTESNRDQLIARTGDGREVTISLANIVRAHLPNDMSVTEKLLDYFVAVGNFLWDEPREANTEGGIFPAIFGTVTMVILMSIIVTPFGVLAAIYLREYAKQGPLLKIIRISVYNLAGVPSIVYGVFGLGFFVYIMGGSIDQLFYPEALPSPTFGTPGLFWASLTLALLTLPVVIVSTEEGLSRIPSTIRMGSLALGATKSETLWKVVVPLATPAMMTGLILAVARAAGEVAPLMLVGVVKLAPTLPIDTNFPFVHLEQKIMHLGFHVFDVGFQSPNVEASRPLLYATALVLVLLIVILNMSAIYMRNRLREKYRSDSD
ncbi:phosphate ABC transporter permease PstA [Rheinheimera marina]|uniref:Phosphate transport system permease protein PstA n=1 Tax=Rheinheimera marina TaxID=1774958 RepID=A0ABV9JN03_9GAMM